MGNLKGTQTEKNLLTAFAGESQARNRYTYFAALPAKDIEDLIKNERELSVAAVNGPESVVVSGAERISDLKKTLEDRDVFTRILKLEYCVIPRTS